jgi:hypothetical protein
MKNQRIFPGIILIGFGVFFFWQQAKISLFAEFISWPSLLMIVGIAFLCQGYGRQTLFHRGLGRARAREIQKRILRGDPTFLCEPPAVGTARGYRCVPPRLTERGMSWFAAC